MIADLEPILSVAPDRRRIYFDLPGHGATTAPGWLERLEPRSLS